MHLFEGKVRGDLDLHFHQSISPLSEGNIWDLDLEVLLWISSFVLPLLFLHKLLLLWWNLGEKDLSTSCVLAIAFGASV